MTSYPANQETMTRRLLALEAEVSAVGTQRRTLSSALQQISETITRYLSVGGTQVWLANETDEVLELAAAAGEARGQQSKLVALGSSSLGRIASDWQPRRCSIAEETEFADSPMVRAGSHHLAGFPLVVEGRITGVLALFAKEPLPEQSFAALTGIANKVALIVQHKLGEENMRRSEERFRLIAENAVALIGVIDPFGHYTYVSPSFQRILSVSPEEALALQFDDLVHPDDLAVVREQFNKGLESGQSWSCEYRMLHAKGGWRYVEATGSMVRNSGGETEQVIVVARDITERRNMEAALAYERDLLRALLDNLPDRIYFKDEQSRFLRCSQALLRQFNLTRQEEIIGKSDFDFFANEHASTAFADEQRILASGQPLVGKVEMERWQSDRPPTWVSTTKMPLRNPEGKIVGTFGISTDVTALKEAEQKIEASEAFLNSLLERLPQNIFRKDREGRFTFVNNNFAQLLGRRKEEIVGKTDADLFPAHLAQKYHDDDERVMQSGEVFETIESNIVDGAERFVQVNKTPLRDAEGKVNGLQGVFWDVTEKVRAERALQKQEAELRRSHNETESLLASLSAGLIGVDVEGRVRRWNQAAERIFGISADEALNRPFFDLRLNWEWHLMRQATMDCCIRGESVELEQFTVKAADGKERTLNIVIAPAAAEPNQMLNFSLLAVDVTERCRLENQLRQAQKLESIGQLAAGVAHEINTPIQFIGDNLRFLKGAFDDLEPVFASLSPVLESTAPEPDLGPLRASVQTADLQYLRQEMPAAIAQSLEGVERVSRIVLAMKDFSHPDVGARVVTNLNRAIESTVTVARNEWKYVADMKLELDPELPSVPCYPGDFNQAILNVVVNAAHAIADTATAKAGNRGQIVVRTRRDGDFVAIDISDSGTGIPENVRAKIFDPFFTTKPVGKGTGQGLYLTHNIVVEKHGGTISFETTPGKGTTFTIRLPLTPGQAIAKAA
jgi:PAS domain S-box-containing protein